MQKIYLCYRTGHKGFRATPYGSGTKGKEELAIDLSQLASHSLPFGIPSLARLCDTKSHTFYRASVEYQNVSFQRTKTPRANDGRWGIGNLTPAVAQIRERSTTRLTKCVIYRERFKPDLQMLHYTTLP